MNASSLMASVPVGRIIYTRRALPAVELVNFALDRGEIVIRTDSSGKLAAATRGAIVAFEADSLDLDLPGRLERHRDRPVAGGDRPDEIAGFARWASAPGRPETGALHPDFTRDT